MKRVFVRLLEGVSVSFMVCDIECVTLLISLISIRHTHSDLYSGIEICHSNKKNSV